MTTTPRIGISHTDPRREAVPVVSWDDDQATWKSVRSQGIGASDVSSILGYSRYTTPWYTWAEKTGHPLPDTSISAPAQLGMDLEPWLREQAANILGATVNQTGHRTYAHPDYPHHLASPDAQVSSYRYLVELKTAGLFGFGVPEGWTEDTVPLAYEFQVRWQMHVMDYDRAYIVALVAGLGIVGYQIDRDAATEKAMVTQVEDWWQRYVLTGTEPPLTTHDNATLGDLYPKANESSVDLTGTDAVHLAGEYLRHATAEKTAKNAKEATAASLKALLGEHEKGSVNDKTLITWSNRLGSIDYKKALLKICEDNQLSVDDHLEAFRRPITRTFAVKENR